jgi:hypothetical protein
MAAPRDPERTAAFARQHAANPLLRLLDEDTGPLARHYPVGVRIHGRAYSLGETISPGLAKVWQEIADEHARDLERQTRPSFHLGPDELRAWAAALHYRALRECARPVLSANT